MSQAAAAAYLSRFRMTDPEGIDTPATACEGCTCWRLELPGGCVVFALDVIEGGRGWINVAGGETSETITGEALPYVESLARAKGARSLGFQTVRRGLVRRTAACGYRLARHVGAGGYVMEKSL